MEVGIRIWPIIHFFVTDVLWSLVLSHLPKSQESLVRHSMRTWPASVQSNDSWSLVRVWKFSELLAILCEYLSWKRKLSKDFQLLPVSKWPRYLHAESAVCHVLGLSSCTIILPQGYSMYIPCLVLLNFPKIYSHKFKQQRENPPTMHVCDDAPWLGLKCHCTTGEMTLIMKYHRPVIFCFCKTFSISRHRMSST